MEFKVILKNILKEFNLNQTQFASCIEVKQAQVSEWLHGKAKPGYDTLKTIALAFDIPANYLLGIEDEGGAKIKD